MGKGGQTAKPKDNLTVGLDCAGLGSDLYGLKKMPHKFTKISLKFWSEEDKTKQALFKFLHSDIISEGETVHYPSMSNRSVKEMPTGDVYSWGPPCPPFSKQGSHKGPMDIRSQPLKLGVEYIAYKRPRVFIMEEVENFVNEYADLADQLLETLRSCQYTVKVHGMNTRGHGIPQNRSRVYITGVKLEGNIKAVNTPEEIEPFPFKQFIDTTDREDRANTEKMNTVAKRNFDRNIKLMESKVISFF